ncbi:MAG: hypothetical protein KIS94_11690 [Chitinophagales bacterium]|nr:hypothetical protein [Chitinophagales bacterium]
MKNKSPILFLAGLLLGVILMFIICKYKICPGTCPEPRVDTVRIYSGDTSAWNVTVVVRDIAGNVVPGATVGFTCISGSYTTNTEGMVFVAGAGTCPCPATATITASKDRKSGNAAMSERCSSYTVVIN